MPRIFRINDRYDDRLDLARLLHDKGLTESAAEIGVWRGDYSDYFMQRWGGKRLHLVDPWQRLDDYDDVRNRDFDPADYEHVLTRMAQFGNRVVIHRTTSAEAVKGIEEFLDFVYIDANHAHEYVLQDLNLWWPKVRRGGVLAGHDVFWYEHPGVTSALVEFCTEKGLVAELVRGDYNELGVQVNAHSWFIEKF